MEPQCIFSCWWTLVLVVHNPFQSHGPFLSHSLTLLACWLTTWPQRPAMVHFFLLRDRHWFSWYMVPYVSFQVSGALSYLSSQIVWLCRIGVNFESKPTVMFCCLGQSNITQTKQPFQITFPDHFCLTWEWSSFLSLPSPASLNAASKLLLQWVWCSLWILFLQCETLRKVGIFTCVHQQPRIVSMLHS